MKDYNVLEAKDLCVNGNKSGREPYTIQQCLFRVAHGVHSHMYGRSPLESAFRDLDIKLREFNNELFSIKTNRRFSGHKNPPPPPPPPGRIFREGDTSFCKKCGSGIKFSFLWLNKLGCRQPECENYHG